MLMEVQNGAATVKNSLAVPSHIKHIYMPAAQSCPTLRGPKDCSLSDSSIHGIFQARILEWAAIYVAEGLCVWPVLSSGWWAP